MTEAEATLSLADPAQAADLMTAQVEVLLIDLQRRRADLTAQIAGLQGQELTGHTRIDKIRADLNAQISSSLTALDTLIEETEAAARGFRSAAASA